MACTMSVPGTNLRRVHLHLTLQILTNAPHLYKIWFISICSARNYSLTRAIDKLMALKNLEHEFRREGLSLVKPIHEVRRSIQ